MSFIKKENIFGISENNFLIWAKVKKKKKIVSQNPNNTLGNSEKECSFLTFEIFDC